MNYVITKIKSLFYEDSNHSSEESLIQRSSSYLFNKSSFKSDIDNKSSELSYKVNVRLHNRPENKDIKSIYSYLQSKPNDESNKISTSKYTIINTIPKILMEQFSKLINIYFLIIAIFQTFKIISNSDGQPVILLPLVIVVTINGAKNFYEDWKRKISDNEENNKKVLRYNSKLNAFESELWENIKKGNIIQVNENEYLPADCILLSSSDKHGICYVETKNIDGETNLKLKKINTEIQNKYKINNIKELKRFVGSYIYCSEPDEYIYKFQGKFIFSNSNQIECFVNNINENRSTYIDYDSFLLRGCSLKQTEYIYAFVVYVGHSTKIMKNAPKIRNKVSNIETIMNRQIILIFICQIILSLISATISIIQMNRNNKNMSYLNANNHIKYTFGFKYYLIQIGTWIILINNIVPISLLVTIEMVKYLQGVFISWDIHLYDKAKRLSAKVQTSTLNEELGQVKFIFTDKTGTLTKNKMRFKAMSIGGEIFGLNESFYGHTVIIKKSSDNITENERELNKNTDHYGTITNFNFESTKFDKVLKDESKQNMPLLTNIDLFMKCLALCHSVTVIKNEPLIYQSSSPDEMATVNCARKYGYIFISRKGINKVILKDKKNNTSEYSLLKVFEYTSERKRMSVLVKYNNKIFLFAKGADCVIKERINKESNILINTEKHLHEFAKNGLRTLMIAYKEISIDDYNNFQDKCRNASHNLFSTEAILTQIYDEMETDLTLLGATAIEDELQDNVSDVLKSFIDTDIKIWVLTGDKVDTAKSIAFSCHLLSHDFFLFEVPEQSGNDDIKACLLRFSKQYYLSDKEHNKYGLIVSYKEIALILSDCFLANLFYSLAIHCNTILCCRVSPKQKSEMVKLVKRNQPNITTLAIGDGLNDVNMINEASIGVGIEGVEGMQAARASDYSISQFKYLKRLLFVHGRESYRKNSFIVCYNFYKNFLFVMPHFWFGFSSFFSGLYLYDPWIYQMFNILYASVPIIWFGIYDKEVSYDILMKDNRYYYQGMTNKLFHSIRFWKWISYGILQASLIFVFSFFANSHASNYTGNLGDLTTCGSIVYSGVIIIVNLKILLYTNTHSVISISLFVFSIGSYFITILCMNRFIVFYNFNNWSMIINSTIYYLSSICLIFICGCLDNGVGILLRIYGIIKDPLKLNPKSIDTNDNIIEMKEDENNNNYSGSAFSKDNNDSISKPIITTYGY